MSRHHFLSSYMAHNYDLEDSSGKTRKHLKNEAVKLLRKDGLESIMEALEGMNAEDLEPCREEGEEFMSYYKEIMDFEDDFSEFINEEDLDDYPGFGTHYDPIKDPGPPTFEYRLDRDLCSLFPAYFN